MDPIDLSHIDGPSSKPIIGHTLDILRDSYGLHRAAQATYGKVYKINLLGQWRVMLHGADALELVLGDREQNFSSAEGWDALENLFPGGLMLRDFDDHRRHRRIMQAAFRAPVLEAYQTRMITEIARLVAQWPSDKSFAFFPAIKDLTLRMGGAVFMGLPVDSAQTKALNTAFANEVAGSFGLIRRPLPLTKMGRGVAGRKYLIETFRDLIPQRRALGGDDFFSQMCLAQDDDGTGWSDEEITDHFNFLMMAAHDTTASALTTMAWAMIAHPEWCDRVQAEVDAGAHLPIAQTLSAMPVTERVFKEALRLVPPVPFIPRRANRTFDYGGVTVPAGAYVTVSPGMVMQSDIWFTNPDQFDPDRFSANRAEDQGHRYAWAPFGGGAHKCIGLHFSTQQVKIFVATLFRQFTLHAAGSTKPNWARMPIPQPKDGLPVRLQTRAA